MYLCVLRFSVLWEYNHIPETYNGIYFTVFQMQFFVQIVQRYTSVKCQNSMSHFDLIENIHYAMASSSTSIICGKRLNVHFININCLQN